MANAKYLSLTQAAKEAGVARSTFTKHYDRMLEAGTVLNDMGNLVTPKIARLVAKECARSKKAYEKKLAKSRK